MDARPYLMIFYFCEALINYVICHYHKQTYMKSRVFCSSIFSTKKALSLSCFLFFSVLLSTWNVEAQTYCTPSYFTTATTGEMDNFSLTGYAGSTINDALSSSTYVDRTTAVSAVYMQQGGSYPCTISYAVSSNYTDNQIWIDFNDDGVFDTATEKVTGVFPSSGVTSTSISSASSTINIPLTAVPGLHRMRVRNVWYYISPSTTFPSPAFDPCLSSDSWDEYYSGLTADYTVDIVALTPCSGKPTAGYITGPSHMCPNTKFSLQDTSLLQFGGMAVQWQSRPTGSTTWTDMTNDTIAATTTTITTGTDFRVYATCRACGTSASCADTSYVFNVAVDPYYQCYCSKIVNNTNLGGSSDLTIDSVTIEGTTLKNATHDTLPNYYAKYPDTLNTTATLTQGGVYTMYVNYSKDLGYGGMWIDYDHSGTFDAGEFQSLNTTSASNGMVRFTVPTSALIGLTGLRIRNYSSSVNSFNPCSDLSRGETEDYIINIQPALGHDLSAIVVLHPAKDTTTCANSNIGVTAIIYNMGGNADSNFRVYATYSGPSSGSTYIEQYAPVLPLTYDTVSLGTIAPPLGGNYILKVYTVLASDSNHGNDTTFTTFHLNAVPAPPVAASDTVCAGNNATILIPASSGINYNWYASDTGNSIIFTGDSLTIPSITSDTTFYILSEYISTGCPSSRIKVNAAIGATPIVDLGTGGTVCASPSLILDAGNPGASYLWSTGATTEKIHIDSSGTYSVTVTKYCSASSSVTLDVQPLPSATGVNYDHSGSTYFFSLADPQNIVSYLWEFGDGDTSTMDAPMHTYADNSPYHVTVILYNNCGTDTIRWGVPTAVANINQPDEHIKIYPNPANTSITISAENNVTFKNFSIVNSVGATIYSSETVGTSNVRIDISNFPPGFYILKANTSQGNFNKLFEVLHN